MRVNLSDRMYALRWLLRANDPYRRRVITDAEAFEMELFGALLLRSARREPLVVWDTWAPSEPRKGLMRFERPGVFVEPQA